MSFWEITSRNPRKSPPPILEEELNSLWFRSEHSKSEVLSQAKLLSVVWELEVVVENIKQKSQTMAAFKFCYLGEYEFLLVCHLLLCSLLTQQTDSVSGNSPASSVQARHRGFCRVWGSLLRCVDRHVCVHIAYTYSWWKTWDTSLGETITLCLRSALGIYIMCCGFLLLLKQFLACPLVETHIHCICLYGMFEAYVGYYYYGLCGQKLHWCVRSLYHQQRTDCKTQKHPSLVKGFIFFLVEMVIYSLILVFLV